MDTITFETPTGQIFEIPFVVAFGPDGKPADLVGDVEPENCDHAGQTWSDCLEMRCTRCGARLFLPGRFLARRPEEVLERMYAAWCAAGWPSFIGGQGAHWTDHGAGWQMLPLPDFQHVGGLPVRADKLEAFAAVTA
jgi:hypothetical protein